jgi:AbrB family looped-hinge helix DNA binding protein
MRLTSKGQVTIPQAIRHRPGLLPNTDVVFNIVNDSVRIRKRPPSVAAARSSRGCAGRRPPG